MAILQFNNNQETSYLSHLALFPCNESHLHYCSFFKLHFANIICVFLIFCISTAECGKGHILWIEKTVRIITFSKDNGTFVLHVMSAWLQLQSFTCCAKRFTLPQKQYHIHHQDLTKHFILGHTIHHIILSISSLHFLWYHLNPKSDINKWKLICLPQNTL